MSKNVPNPTHLHLKMEKNAAQEKELKENIIARKKNTIVQMEKKLNVLMNFATIVSIFYSGSELTWYGRLFMK